MKNNNAINTLKIASFGLFGFVLGYFLVPQCTASWWQFWRICAYEKFAVIVYPMIGLFIGILAGKMVIKK